MLSVPQILSDYRSSNQNLVSDSHLVLTFGTCRKSARLAHRDKALSAQTILDTNNHPSGIPILVSNIAHKNLRFFGTC